MVLQQRTFHDLDVWCPPGYDDPEAGCNSRRSKSAALAPEGLILGSLKPFVSLSLTELGRHVGVVTNSPEVGSIRLVRAVGTRLEDSISNGSALLFVALRSPQERVVKATFQVIDYRGGVVSTSKH